MGEEQSVLEHDADGPALGRQTEPGGDVLEDLAIQDHRAPIQLRQPGDGPQHGRLARPVGADERRDLARAGHQGGVDVQGPGREGHAGL